MSKHTRGPWELEIVGNSEPSGTGHDLWDVMGPNLLVTVAENVHDRDAALIAAAPELLEALRAAMPHLEAAARADNATYALARAALAKADGADSKSIPARPEGT